MSCFYKANVKDVPFPTGMPGDAKTRGYDTFTDPIREADRAFDPDLILGVNDINLEVESMSVKDSI